MNKVIFEAVGNTIMFVLLALFFTEGLTVLRMEDGIEISANIFVLIFIIYLFAYVAVLAIWNWKQGAPFSHLITGLQMYQEIDERESVITMKATRTAYTTTIFAVPIALMIFAAFGLDLLSFDASADIFKVGVWLFALCCVAINLAFSVAWCVEERK